MQIQTPNQKILILPASSIQEAAILFTRAYRQDPVVLSLLNRVQEPARTRVLEKYWDAVIRFAIRYGSALSVFEGRRLVGVKLLYTHRQYPFPFFPSLLLSLKVARRLAPLIGLSSILRYLKIMGQLSAQHPKKPHFYSEVTCVDPDFQGRGIYSSLQHHMITLAEKEQKGIYVESSNPKSVEIIQRFGFQVTHEQNLAGITYWSLWKNPILEDKKIIQ